MAVAQIVLTVAMGVLVLSALVIAGNWPRHGLRRWLRHQRKRWRGQQ